MTMLLAARRNRCTFPSCLASLLAMTVTACGAEDAPTPIGAPLTSPQATGASPTINDGATPPESPGPTSSTTSPSATHSPSSSASSTAQPDPTNSVTTPPAFPAPEPTDSGSTTGAGGTTGGPSAEPTPTMAPTAPGAGGEGGEEPAMETPGGAGGMDVDTDAEVEPVGPRPVVPSDGCGSANPPTGSANAPLMASGHQYYVKLPNNYDPNTPYQVIIMFNPTGNPISWAEQNAGYEQAASDAIRVYPHMSNQNSGWQPNETSFFQGLYDALTSSFCIDKARVFAAGESSGGEFAGFLGCEYGDLLRGVAPGAPKQTSWQINLANHDCKGNPAAIVIWSPMDNVLQSPTGSQFRDFYHDMNMCGDSTVPVDGFTNNLSNCEMYEECAEGSPVYFCQHSDPTYSNSYHGWPAFAGRMTWQVFSEL